MCRTAKPTTGNWKLAVCPMRKINQGTQSARDKRDLCRCKIPIHFRLEITIITAETIPRYIYRVSRACGFRLAGSRTLSRPPFVVTPCIYRLGKPLEKKNRLIDQRPILRTVLATFPTPVHDNRFRCKSVSERDKSFFFF